MIFVTLGTQDKPFYRLLEIIQKEIKKGNIKDKVVVQAGCTKFVSDDMEIFDLIPMDDFSKMISECDLLITHGGVGSIIDGLKKGKKIIAGARLAKFGEHVNDHQKQIIENFSKSGYILGLNDDFSNMKDLLKEVKNFKPKKYKSNTQNMIKLVQEKIAELT